MIECKGYTDSNGTQYYLGDIVLNPWFGDLYIVEEADDDIKDDCPYMLSQYGDASNYCMALDEPAGFIIVCHKNDKDYADVFKSMEDEYRRIQEREGYEVDEDD